MCWEARIHVKSLCTGTPRSAAQPCALGARHLAQTYACNICARPLRAGKQRSAVDPCELGGQDLAYTEACWETAIYCTPVRVGRPTIVVHPCAPGSRDLFRGACGRKLRSVFSPCVLGGEDVF